MKSWPSPASSLPVCNEITDCLPYEASARDGVSGVAILLPLKIESWQVAAATVEEEREVYERCGAGGAVIA